MYPHLACSSVVFSVFASVADELHFWLSSTSFPLKVSKVPFRHPVDGLRTYRFLACLSSDLGGVWPFRIRCQRASFLSLCRLGCATFFAHLLRSFTCLSFNGFEGAVSAPCGRVANALFLACLSSHLGGVWPFRIRCRRASFLSLSRLGCATFFAHLFAHLLRSFTCLSCNGFESAVSAPCGRVANAPFLAYLSSDLGGVWPFRIRCRLFVFVQVRLRHVFCPPICSPTAVLYLSLLAVSKVQFQHRVQGLRTHCFWLA